MNNKNNRGWVYIISNKGMPGLLKIGFTLKDPASRAKDLGGTGAAHDYIVEYDVPLENPKYYEQKIHMHLSKCRENIKREWFRCTLDEAIAAVHKVAPSNKQSDEKKLRKPKYEIRYENGNKYVNGVYETDYTAISPATTRKIAVLSRDVFITQEFDGVNRLASTNTLVGHSSTSWTSRCKLCSYQSRKIFLSNRYWCTYCKAECEGLSPVT